MSRRILMGLLVGVLGCGSEPAAVVGADGGDDAGPDAAGPPKVADQHFVAFEPWARPIDDYLAVGEQVRPGEFNAGIHDLAPFGGRLWLAYGDADYNLGEQIPIELRYFAAPDDPRAAAAEVAGEGQGAPQVTPLQSGEEQIDRYRVLDGALWQAGVDSIDADELFTQQTTDPRGIEGNVYRLEGERWLKFRSLVGGEHVHDLASWQGAVYAVGSGADTRAEFEAGQIFRYLWQSTDGGATFATVTRVAHPAPGTGDSRWVHLLATPDTLYLFGYESDFAANRASIRNAVFDGATVTDLEAGHPLRTIFPFGTLSLPDGSGLAWGVDIALDPARLTVTHVAVDGSTAALAGYAGWTVVDVSLVEETDEIVILAIEGDDYGATRDTFTARVLVADRAAPGAAAELAGFTSEIEPRSIAYFGGALFLGTADGQVLRASGSGG